MASVDGKGATAPIKSLDDALDEIVEFAKIPKDCRPYFRNLVRGTVSDAVPHIKKLKPFSDDKIVSQFRALMHKAHALLADLKTMEKGSRAGNALEIAGLSLRAAAMDEKLTIKHFIDQLELLAKVVEVAVSDIRARQDRVRRARAGRSAAGRPRGTPGNIGFDFFVRQLRDDARAAGGKLGIHKSRDQISYDGSLLKTIKLLRAHLPDKFVPEKTDLGRRLYRIFHRH
jgi:hypothetical protein